VYKGFGGGDNEQETWWKGQLLATASKKGGAVLRKTDLMEAEPLSVQGGNSNDVVGLVAHITTCL
jgi:hypothetical protein